MCFVGQLSTRASKLSHGKRRGFWGLLTLVRLSATDMCDKISLGFTRSKPRHITDPLRDSTAQDTLVGIELMHMIKKRPMVVDAEDEGRTAAELFSSLATSTPLRQGHLSLPGPPV